MISRPYSTVEFYTTSTSNSVSSYCNNTLVLRVRDSYYKYQSVKRTEAPACPLAQASCTTRTSDSPTRLYVCRICSGYHVCFTRKSQICIKKYEAIFFHDKLFIIISNGNISNITQSIVLNEKLLKRYIYTKQFLLSPDEMEFYQNSFGSRNIEE
ncbi:hypothetical protein H8356DRAFT_1321631 [Neocallimastix lanati (nom. inval.)]|nr:hypothetical protein H8356DRAFT_1321631 [Neocallimastix sp. JGI-2020a]